MNGKQMIKLVQKVSEAIFDKKFRSRKNYVRPPFIFWGPAGSGKSMSIAQAATEINAACINIRLGQENEEDMSFPDIKTYKNGEKSLGKIIAEIFPRILKDAHGNPVMRREVVDGEIVTTEEPCINIEAIKGYVENYEHIKNHYENLGLTVNDAKGVIFFLDELNRVESKSLFQMIFQLFDSGKFKGQSVPENVAMFGACNPNKGHIVANWFDDKAFSNRCIHLRTEFDLETWLEFAKKPDSGYTDIEIELVETYPDVLFDKSANDFKIPQVERSYRNIAFLSNFVSHIEWEEDEEDIKISLIQAILGETFVGPYQNVIEKIAQKAIKPEEILEGYDEYDVGSQPFDVVKDGAFERLVPNTVLEKIETQEIISPVRKKFVAAVENGRDDFVDKVRDDLTDYLFQNINNEEFQKFLDKNRLRFIRFFLDLPRGKYATFMKGLFDSEDKEKSNLLLKTLVTGEKISSKAFTSIVKHIEETVKNGGSK